MFYGGAKSGGGVPWCFALSAMGKFFLKKKNQEEIKEDDNFYLTQENSFPRLDIRIIVIFLPIFIYLI